MDQTPQDPQSSAEFGDLGSRDLAGGAAAVLVVSGAAACFLRSTWDVLLDGLSQGLHFVVELGPMLPPNLVG